MSELKRYGAIFDGDGQILITPMDMGRYVKYSEAAALLDEKDKEIEQLTEGSSENFSCYEVEAEKAKALAADNQRLREALDWYAKQVGDCNRRGQDGDIARDRLAKDVGKRAQQALAATAQDDKAVKSSDGTFDDGYVFGKPSPETFRKCAEEIQKIFSDDQPAQGDNERKEYA